MDRRRERRAAAPLGELRPEEAVARAIATALRALARRPRSRVEIEALLAKRGAPGAAIDAALADLTARGLLDDVAVAGAVGREAVARRLGSRRVAQVLARRGVRGAAARVACEESRALDLDLARALLARRFPDGVGDRPAERARAARLLAGRGFPGGIVRRALGIDVDVGTLDAAPAETPAAAAECAPRESDAAHPRAERAEAFAGGPPEDGAGAPMPRSADRARGAP